MFVMTIYIHLVLLTGQSFNVMVGCIPYGSLSECLRASSAYVVLDDAGWSNVEYTATCNKAK